MSLRVVLASAEPMHEFIFEDAPFESCHASTLLETANGGLLAAWFGGTEEGHPDAAIWMSRKQKGGSWSAPREVFREEGAPAWNPVLFRAANGVVWLFYKFGPSPREWTGGYRSSTDGGRTWSAPRSLPAGLLGPVRSKPLILDDGTIVAGTSVESYQAWACWVEISRDHGYTWTRHGPIVHPEEPFGVIQPTVVPISRGRLRMFMRSRNIGRICYADSADGGRTWSGAKETNLPNPNSGIDALRLRDGRLALIYNHTSKGRTPLSLAVSADDGVTWKQVLTLEDGPGEYSYPALIEARDGSLHMSYTWKRERIKHVRVPLEEVR